MNMYQYAQYIGSILKQSGITLSICESCTGGMLSSTLTSVPGSSQYFQGSIIAYANEVKTRLVGVRKSTLEQHGAVSKQAAQEMAQGVRNRLQTDIGLSITGIAGPSGGTRMKPVGRVYIGLATAKQVSVYTYTFHGSRKSVRKQSCLCALQVLENAVTARSGISVHPRT